MKRIHFDNMRNKFWITFLIFSLILILVGAFELFHFENPKLNRRITIIGFLLYVVFYSRMFWYKNYVQWNKKGVNIKVNSFLGNRLSFDQVKTTELNENTLTVTKTNGKTITIDLNEIEESDSKKLNEIIIRNTIAGNV